MTIVAIKSFFIFLFFIFHSFMDKMGEGFRIYYLVHDFFFLFSFGRIAGWIFFLFYFFICEDTKHFFYTFDPFYSSLFFAV